MNVFNDIKFVLVFISFFVCLNVFPQEGHSFKKWISLNGYIKDLQSSYFADNIDSLSSLTLIHNRLNFKFNLFSKLTARLEIRNRIYYGDQLQKTVNFGKVIDQEDGYLNLSKLWLDGRTLVVHSSIDRMLFQYETEKLDIKIGRQRVNWGINNIWNPNDLFNAYNVLDFDYEERSGVDALRIQYYFSANSSFDFAVKPSKNKNKSVAALMYKFNRSNYDFQFLGGKFNSDLVIGGGWAGSIKEAGFKGEISYFHPQDKVLDTSGVFGLSLMADRTFKNDWYASVAFLYNSNPGNLFVGSGGSFNAALSAKSLFPFRYSFYVGVVKSISPITSLNFSFIYSPYKNTFLLLPSFVWNVAENFDLDLTLQSFNMESYGSYKNVMNSFNIRARWSF